MLMDRSESLLGKVHSMARALSTGSGPSHKGKVQGTTRIAISKFESDWNLAAIQLAVENEKLPSQRSAGISLKLLPARRGAQPKKISTNDWNVLALARQQSKLTP